MNSPPPAFPGSRDVTRVLVSGDWHGDEGWAHHIVTLAGRLEAQAVVVCGDHGVLWPGADFDHELSTTATKAQVHVVLVPGNHDDHHRLDRLPRHASGLAALAPNVWHASRPSRFTLGTKVIGALGGALSIDACRRTPGVSWWAEELITPDHVRELGKARVDVLFTHEAPVRSHLRFGVSLLPHLEAGSAAQRRLVLDAVRNTVPAVVFHGHHHQRRDGSVELGAHGAARVVGLDKQRTAGAWVLLELDSLAVRDPRKGQVSGL